MNNIGKAAGEEVTGDGKVSDWKDILGHIVQRGFSSPCGIPVFIHHVKMYAPGRYHAEIACEAKYKEGLCLEVCESESSLGMFMGRLYSTFQDAGFPPDMCDAVTLDGQFIITPAADVQS